MLLQIIINGATFYDNFCALSEFYTYVGRVSICRIRNTEWKVF